MSYAHARLIHSISRKFVAHVRELIGIGRLGFFVGEAFVRRRAAKGFVHSNEICRSLLVIWQLLLTFAFRLGHDTLDGPVDERKPSSWEQKSRVLDLTVSIAAVSYVPFVGSGGGMEDVSSLYE